MLVMVGFDYSMRLLGPCLVVLALGLFASVMYLFFLYLLPIVVGPEVGVLWWMHGGFAIFLLGNILYNYYYCVTTNPGNPSEDDPAGRYVYNDSNWGPGRIPDSSSVDPRSYGFCKKCRIPRPPRWVSVGARSDGEGVCLLCLRCR